MAFWRQVGISVLSSFFSFTLYSDNFFWGYIHDQNIMNNIIVAKASHCGTQLVACFHVECLPLNCGLFFISLYVFHIKVLHLFEGILFKCTSASNCQLSLICANISPSTANKVYPVLYLSDIVWDLCQLNLFSLTLLLLWLNHFYFSLHFFQI